MSWCIDKPFHPKARADSALYRINVFGACEVAEFW
jgi:hypothetical protein